MSELLQRMRIDVAADNDVVVLSVGHASLRFGYPTAFKIAQGLRVAGKHAMRNAGIPVNTHRAVGDFDTNLPAAPLHPEYRRTAEPLAGQPWRVDVENTRVALHIGNTALRVDHDAALQMATWLRMRAKEAKRWAGDTSRTMRIAGTLTAHAG